MILSVFLFPGLRMSSFWKKMPVIRNALFRTGYTVGVLIKDF